MSERSLMTMEQTDERDFASSEKSSAMVITLPVTRLLKWLAGAVLIVAAVVAGFRLSAGPVGLDALLAPRSEAGTGTAFVELPEVIVNLHPESRSRHLKIAVTVAVPPEQRDRLARQEPQLMNAMQAFLRGLDDTDLQGSAGLFRLRDELRRRLQLVAADVTVTDVLLRNLLTQ